MIDRIEQREIDMVLNDHRNVGSMPLRIVQFIRQQGLLPTDPLYIIYH